MGKVATSPLPPRGSPPLQSGGQNQKWPTSGQASYITPAASGIPTASERGAKSEVAHTWARWLHNPCRRGDPHRFRAGGQNQKWTINGQGGYITLATSGIPTASERGAKSEWAEVAHPHRFRAGGKMGKVATSPLPPRGSPLPTASERGAKSKGAHKWVRWLHHPDGLGDPHRFKAGGKIRRGPQVGKVATSPLPPRGSPPLQSGGQNPKCPKKCGNATSPLHYGGSLAKGTKSKVAESEARTKLWMCSPKEYHEKRFAQMMCLRRKTPLKPPLRPFLKQGGGVQNPPRYQISQKPRPLVCHQDAQKGTPVRCDRQGTPCTLLYPSLRPFRHQHYCLLRFEVVCLLLLAGPVCHHAVPFCGSFVSATRWRVQFHPRCTKLQHLCNPFWQVAVHTLFGERNRHAWRFYPCLALVATFASTRSGILPVNRPHVSRS